jgi:N-acylglucosamine-6-phosphate 2-epimerase
MLKRGLIVSCQAEEGSPFNATPFIVAFAKAAELGGAIAVRICGIENIKAVRQQVALPIIGITKGTYPDGRVLITPTVEDAAAIIAAGADCVALDATHRHRANGMTGTAMVEEVKNHLAAPVMADVAALAEGLDAAKAGADWIGTTLSGYTAETQQQDMSMPNLMLVADLAQRLPNQIIAEGRIWTPEQAQEALRLGALAVVVGTAITRPVEIVKRFVRSV